MTIQRRYEPDDEALERVVEVLCRLLVEAPDGRAESDEPASAEAQTPTCIERESE
jgi:hypothetical protein